MKTLPLALCLSIVLPAAAQPDTVWRCGADGRSYSATPCAEGRALEPVGSPSPADRQAAQRVAASDIRLAEQMRNERLRSEADGRRHALTGLQTSPPGPAVNAGSAKAAKPRQPAASGTWRAVAPATRRARG